MSCGGETQKFRLLDGFVGWDAADNLGLTGLGYDEAEGLRLSQCNPDAVAPADLLAYLPPPRLAHGCERCDWFLVDGSRLLRRDCCTPGWLPVWSAACDQHLLKGAVAIAVRGRRLAVSDPMAKKVWMWVRDGERFVASIDLQNLITDSECDHPNAKGAIEQAGPLAFTPRGELLVADVATNSIWRFGPSGELRGKLRIALRGLNPQETIERLAASDDCSIWIVTKMIDGSLRLWRAGRGERKFSKASIDQLRKSFKPTTLTAADADSGFCLEECGPDGMPVPYCFNWKGEPLETAFTPPPPPVLHRQGQLLTQAIDSGTPRCRWHRVRIDADVPPGTVISVAVATSETEGSLSTTTSRDTEWDKFLAGVPHPLDWQTAQPGTLDFLIDQPPGRYLYLRLRLKTDDQQTPVVRRVRLDFPRVTSLDNLPAVYRDNPEAEDFTERFLSLFDAAIADLDRAIDRAPALLDPEGVPDEVLPWLGSFLDIVFDPAWDPDLRREILRALPRLYRRRGTIAGLVDAINVVFGFEPAIQELAAERNWGSVAQRDGAPNKNAARLGTVRLFGRSRARFRLNSSSLGNAPLRSYGNPNNDALLAQVFRFRVLAPAHRITTPNARAGFERLVASQKPAHTVASVRFGGEGFIVGNTSAVGVDTTLAPLPPSVIGKAGNFRLHRMSVLWHGKHGTRKGISLNKTSVLGMNMVVE